MKPFVCDVTDLAQVKNVLDEVCSVSDCMVRGVVHAAVSWRDLSFDKLSTDRWRESLAAKVQGTKNLHETTRSMPLDFFIMTTSPLSVFAIATQAAYTAANNFQDAFARYRRALELPATAISFGLIRDVGNTGSDSNTVDTFERNKSQILSEQQFLALLESAFLDGTPARDEGADPLSAANLITCLDPARMVATIRGGGSAGSAPRWHADGRVAAIMRAYADAQKYALNQSAQDTANDGGNDAKLNAAHLQQKLEAGIQAGPGERSATVALVEAAIIAAVADMLFIDREGIDSSKSAADHGVDSLIAAELRNWFIDVLKVNISMLKLLDQSTSMNALAANIVDDALAQAASGAA